MRFSEWLEKRVILEKDNRGGARNGFGPQLRRAASTTFNFFKNTFGSALKSHKKRI